MASSIASHTLLEGSPGGPLAPIYLPKLTAIDKIGGIYCHQCGSVFGNKKEFDVHYSQHITGGGDIVYTCVICKKQIIGYPSFRGHCYVSHVVRNKFQCQHCLKRFSKQSILTGHISAVHDFKCSACDAKFSSKKELQCHKYIHKSKAKDEPPYNCFNCGEQLNTIDSCETHIDDHCEVLYPCPICDEVLISKMDATKHLNKHFDETLEDNITVTSNNCEDSSIDVLGGILCCHCDILFKNRAEFDSHFTLDHDDKTLVYTCHICGKHYEKYSLFGNHCHFHINKDKFQCDQCERAFPRLSLLVTHTDAFHSAGAPDKPYRCDKCGHGFKDRYRLYDHMRAAHNEIYIKCPLPGCNTGFDSPKDMSVHLRKHKARLERWCRSCGLQLGSLGAAARHLDVHRRKRYACPVCARSYAEKYLTMKHVPQHFAATIHACRVCGRAYPARNRLIQHLKTHSDSRPHKCTFCPKSFVLSNQLKQHLNVHSTQRPYECVACPKTFTNYSNWRKHLICVHKFDKSRLQAVRAAREQKLAARANGNEEHSGSESEGSAGMDAVEESDEDAGERSRAAPETAPPPPPPPALSAPAPAAHKYGMDVMSVPLDEHVMSAVMPNPVAAVVEQYIAPDISKNKINEMKCDYFTAAKADDMSDIEAIVEHIDAMSGHLDVPTRDDAALPTDIMHFTEIPVANANITVFNPEEPPLLTSLPPACPLEYGPDFSLPDPESCSSGFIDLDDHNLPHIDPLLTIKAVRPPVYSPPNYPYDGPTILYQQENWEPLITKICPYDECSDGNRMFIVNSNIF